MKRLFCKWIMLDVLGWKITGHFPSHEEAPKYIVVAAPHTTNWDLPLGLATSAIERARIGFIGKKSLFRPLYGWFFRFLGGIPVNRSKSSNYVSSVVDVIHARERFAICIAPEGTRQRVEKLRTGFYWIAREAGIPLVLTALDYEHKELRISDLVYTTDNDEADLEQILNFFRGVKGKHPEKSIYF